MPVPQRQDVNHLDILNADILQALADAPQKSNPYSVAALYVQDLIEQRAPLTAVSVVDESEPIPAWIVVLPTIFLILFMTQIILSGLCLLMLSKTEKFWLARISKIGLVTLNTRVVCLIMASLFSACLSADLVAFFLAIFSVTGADSRFLILSIEWLPCFLAGWVFLWGLGSGVFEAAFQAGRPIVTHKASSLIFNLVVVILPLGMTISQMSIFIMAQNKMVEAINVGQSIENKINQEAPKYNPARFNATTDILPKLIPLQGMVPHEIEMARYLVTGRMMWIYWAVLLLVLTVPLVTLHLKTLKETIRRIAHECKIDFETGSTLANHQTPPDEPFSGPNLTSSFVRQQKSLDLQARFRAERRANKISLAIFLSYLSVYLILCVANKVTSGMDQHNYGARLAVALLIVGKASVSLLGLLITLKFYSRLRSGSKEELEQGSGSVFGAGMQFHQEVAMVIEDASLRRIAGADGAHYPKNAG